MYSVQTVGSIVAKKPLCLVTGGAAGFGFELARVFAEAGCDLVLSGEGGIELDLAAEELAACAPDVQIRWVSADLTRANGPATLHHKLRTLEQPIDIFVANASVGAWGDFGRAASLEDELATAQVNALSTLHLARLLGRDMAEQGRGQIVLGAATPSSACAFDTVQHASRAFTQALADGLAHELEDKNVLVTCLCPEIEAAGPCARLHDPDAVLAIAREAAARAGAGSGAPRRDGLGLDMRARIDRYLQLAAETPMA